MPNSGSHIKRHIVKEKFSTLIVDEGENQVGRE
jgi:hypothetical protein